jgi:hypothetical protein
LAFEDNAIKRMFGGKEEEMKSKCSLGRRRVLAEL